MEKKFLMNYNLESKKYYFLTLSNNYEAKVEGRRRNTNMDEADNEANREDKDKVKD